MGHNRAEKTLVQSESKYRLIADNVSDVIWTMDTNLKFTYTSPSVKKLRGYSPEEALNQTLEETLTPASLVVAMNAFKKEAAREKIRQGNLKGSRTLELELICKDGSTVCADSKMTFLRDSDGRIAEILGVTRNISERKKAERTLKESEEKYRSLVETISDFVFTLDLKGRFSYLNPNFERITGYTQQDLIRHPFTEVLAPEYIKSTVGRFRRGLAGETIPIYEVEIRHKNGVKVPVELHVTSLVDADGKPIGRIGIARDITDRKRAEQELRNSEERYRTIFEATGTATIILDEDTTILMANTEFENLAGCSKDELEGNMSWTEFVVEEDLERMKGYHKLRRIDPNAAPKSYEYRLIDKEGNIKDVSLIVSMIPGTKNSVASSHDITDRKRVEEALQKSEELFRSLVDNMLDSAIIVDWNGTVLFANKAATNLVQLESPEDALGLNIKQFIHTDSMDAVFRDLNLIKQGDYGHYSEYKLVTSKGEERWIEGLGVEIKYDEKSADLVTLRNITKRKRAEEERQKIENQLEHAKKMESLGALAGGVAHDLNNVLSGIVSYPELLLMQLPEDSPLRKPLTTIQKSGEKAAAIVQDMLTLARRGVAVTEVVKLNDIVSEYLQTPECEKLKSFHPGVKIETNLEENLLNIMGSPVHLSKTAMNLISNAAEAMPDGGKIIVSTQNRYISEPVKGYDDIKEGDYVTLAVFDTGIGISAGDMEKIFDPFYTKKVMGRSGTGLGMTVVWGTVKDHNGYIDVESTEGKGTTFTLYFPVTRKESVKDKSLINIEDYMGGGETVLVVDDIEEQREIASVMLKKLGYSVTSVSSGEEAIDYMKDHSADLLILDMIMDPGIDGLETYRKILELHPGQKAIIASGFSESKRVKQVQKLGSGTYVKKPYLLKKIGIAVRGELDKPRVMKNKD